jgi:hypothetical protein
MVRGMIDPLGGFDWLNLHRRYDALCRRFDSNSLHLVAFNPPPQSDRDLYSRLVHAVQLLSGGTRQVSIGVYEATLYWKLYSNHQALGNVGRWLAHNSGQREVAAASVAQLTAWLPSSVPREAQSVVEIVRQLGQFQLTGMKTASALPVRTTVLHLFFPDVVPIFDKMVLQAVGVGDKDANHDLNVLEKYIPFAWSLAERYAPQLAAFPDETPVRVIDMALWVTRNNKAARTGSHCSADLPSARSSD